MKDLAEWVDYGPDTFVCRAPGRVNLIGEHTDYNGLPVLPMTIDREIVAVAVPTSDSTVHVRSLAFPNAPAEFENETRIASSPPGAWENYCKAAVQALNVHFQVDSGPGMTMALASTLPAAAGLSSSSALVVVCALAYLRCLGKKLGKDITRPQLAALLAEGEHYVGTQGGGMDHAIILLGKEGAASKIDFFPIRLEDVPLLPNHRFVVCNSFVQAAKTGAARHRYNEGPTMCRLVCAMVEKYLKDQWDEGIRVERLGDLWQGHLCLTDAEVEDLFSEIFPYEHISLSAVARFFGLGEDDVRRQWLRDCPTPAEGFRLKARARHQVREFQRVETARDALLLGDAAMFGELMNASHESCALDYGISCPELDMLVSAARAAGAMGARLTGAGFGGATINLVPADQVESFCHLLDQTYYEGVDSAHRHLTVTSVMGAGYVSLTDVA